MPVLLSNFLILFAVVTAWTAFFLLIQIVGDERKASRLKRAMYHNMAKQKALLLFIINLVLFCFILCMLLVNYFFFRQIPQELYLFWYSLPFFYLIGILTSWRWIVSLNAKKTFKESWFWIVLTLWASLKTACCALILAWIYLAQVPMIVELTSLPAELPLSLMALFEQILGVLTSVLAYTPFIVIAYWIFFILVASLVFSYAYGMIFALIRRQKDDYGRDYYQLYLAGQAKSCVKYCAVFLVLCLLICFLFQQKLFTLGGFLGQSLVPWYTLLEIIPAYFNYIAWFGVFCLPLSFGLWVDVMRSKAILRSKTLIWLAPILCLIGMTFLNFMLIF